MYTNKHVSPFALRGATIDKAHDAQVARDVQYFHERALHWHGVMHEDMAERNVRNVWSSFHFICAWNAMAERKRRSFW
jgi:tRNA A-37 threonylcarbamoyl transferase component Bud32